MPIAGKAFAQHAHRDASGLPQAQIIRHRWRRRPPRPAHFAALAMRALRMFFEAGPLGLLRHVNARTHALVRDDYAAGRFFDELQDEDLSSICVAMAALDYRPRPVIMPVYNTDERTARRYSISIDQIYTDWESCIADDHPERTGPRRPARIRSARFAHQAGVSHGQRPHLGCVEQRACAGVGRVHRVARPRRCAAACMLWPLP